MKPAVLLLIPALLLAGVARGQEASQQQEQESPVVEQEPPSALDVFDPVTSRLPPGAPDQVVTVDGNAFTGEVKELVGARLKFKTTATDDVFIKWELVRTVRTSRFFEVELRGGARLYGVLVGTDDGRLFVGAESSFSEIDRSQVVGITRIRQGFWERLKGSVSVGIGVSKTASQRDITANASVWYRTRISRFELSGSSYVRRQEGAESVNRNKLAFTYTRFLPKKWLATGLVSTEHNEELGLDLRAFAGAGAGYHLVRTIRHDLLVWGGAAASQERFLGETETLSSLEGIVAARYTFYLLSVTNTTVDLQGALFPSLTEAGRLRSQVEMDIRHEFTKDLYVSLAGFFTSDSDARAGASSSDYGLSLGAGVTW